MTTSTADEVVKMVGTVISQTILDDAQALFRTALRIGTSSNPVARDAIKQMGRSSAWFPSSDVSEMVGDAAITASYVIPGMLAVKGAKIGTSAAMLGVKAAKAAKATRKAEKALIHAKKVSNLKDVERSASAANHAAVDLKVAQRSARAAQSAKIAKQAQAYTAMRNAKIAAVPQASQSVYDVTTETINYDRQPNENFTAYRRRKSKRNTNDKKKH